MPASLAHARQAAGTAAPLHMVRGHYKNYGLQAPLLDKHTGTYWWTLPVHGTAQQGRVTSYKIRPTQHGESGWIVADASFGDQLALNIADKSGA